MTSSSVRHAQKTDKRTLNHIEFIKSYVQMDGAARDEILIADEIEKIAKKHGSKTLLDCAAGFGMPSHPLRERGHDIVCSDGDPEIVKEFRKRAKLRSVDHSCHVLRWGQLSTIGQKFDLVLCIGNSLVYGNSWSGRAAVADAEELQMYIRDMADVTKEGGVLCIDIPVDHSGGHYEETVQLHSEHRDVTIKNTVLTHADSRLWCMDVQEQTGNAQVQNRHHERHSSKISPGEVTAMLEQAGFNDVAQTQFKGNRKNLVTLIATKAS